MTGFDISSTWVSTSAEMTFPMVNSLANHPNFVPLNAYLAALCDLVHADTIQRITGVVWFDPANNEKKVLCAVVTRQGNVVVADDLEGFPSDSFRTKLMMLGAKI